MKFSEYTATPQTTDLALSEAGGLPLLYTRSGLIDGDDPAFNSTGRSYTDLERYDQDEQQATCLVLATTNPFAHRFVALMEAFVGGEGPVPVAADPNVRSLINDFWYNDWNKMPERSLAYIRELAIFGEQLYKLTDFADVKDVPQIFENGLLGLQVIDPIRIYAVKHSTYDNMNVDYIQLKKESNQAAIIEDDPKLRLRAAREKLVDGRRRLVDGDTLFLKINSAITSTRGLSDLYPLADYLGLYTSIQFNMAQQAKQRSFWFYDVLMEGANRQAIQEMRIELQKHPPQPGSVQVHNEKATMEPKAVQMGSSDVGEINDAMFGTITTGMGWPAHWTPLAGQGRSVAEAAHDPAIKLFLTRQAKVRNAIMKMLRVQIDHASVYSTRLDNVKDEQYKLIFPKLAMRDFQRSGGVAARMAQAIRDSMEAGVMTKKAASSLLGLAFEQAGLIDTMGSTSEMEGGDPLANLTTSESIHLSHHLSTIEDIVDEVMESAEYPSDALKEHAADTWRDIAMYHLIN